ncbi:MAG: hypothetical protein ABIG11_01145, partial [bacterium]
QTPLPALPRHTAFELKRARMPAGNSLRELGSAGISAADTPVESAGAKRTEKPFRRGGIFGQAKMARSIGFKSMSSSSGATGSAMGEFSARTALTDSNSVFRVREYILSNYTAADERYGKKAVNRFKQAGYVPKSGAGNGKCEKHGTRYILNNRIYCIFPDRIMQIESKKEDSETGTFTKQLWDIFEYNNSRYLLLNVIHYERHFFEYYSLEPEKIVPRGEIGYGGL